MSLPVLLVYGPGTRSPWYSSSCHSKLRRKILRILNSTASWSALSVAVRWSSRRLATSRKCQRRKQKLSLRPRHKRQSCNSTSSARRRSKPLRFCRSVPCAAFMSAFLISTSNHQLSPALNASPQSSARHNTLYTTTLYATCSIVVSCRDATTTLI